MKKRLRRLNQDVTDFTKLSIGLGMGGAVLGSMPGASSASTGIKEMASFMPVVGTVIGAKYALDTLKDIKPKRRRKR